MRKIKVVQSTLGVFWHFELARELKRRGFLEKIYSSFPWRRLQREDIPRQLVDTFPFFHTAQILAQQRGWLSPRMAQFAHRINSRTFDRWLARRITPCDVLISLFGSALEAGRVVQARGGRFVVDSGSCHRHFQSRILAEEHRLWNQPWTEEDSVDMARSDLILEQADAIVVPSEVARRTFVDCGVPPAKVHAIPFGVLLDRFEPVDHPPSGPGACFEVLFVGGVNLRKGIPYLLQGFAQLQHPHKRLRIAGAIDPSIQQLLQSLPQQNVELLGPIRQSKLPALMSTSHVLVLPSIEDGFGLVVPQAMACACPALVSENTGAADLITEGVEGFVLPIRSPEAIARRLQQLADDPALQARMSSAALARVQKIGGWAQYGDQWQALLEALIPNP